VLGVFQLAIPVSTKAALLEPEARLLASIPLLVDTRSWVGLPPGLDYYSTFQIGLYTQPLAFLLLAAWLAVYVRTRTMRHWRWTLSCLLLASAALANFFVAVIAALSAAVTLLFDAVKYLRAARRRADAGAASEARTVLLAHLLCPAVSLGLTLFWVVPMLATYIWWSIRRRSKVVWSLSRVWARATTSTAGAFSSLKENPRRRPASCRSGPRWSSAA
jgi:hypothetical protein